MPERINWIALCSTAIIDVVEEDPNWWPELEPVIADAKRGKVSILVSEVSVAECTRLRKHKNSPIPYQEGKP